ncbi:hypothetical protein RND81_02G040800 [Saponaria officinalis]|uniref:Uncharacterized protein n=1 Tax=Saponaria officinalis TaxID=3572 RepID=A0AAW1MQT2_SAPOF
MLLLLVFLFSFDFFFSFSTFKHIKATEYNSMFCHLFFCQFHITCHTFFSNFLTIGLP